MHAPRFLPFLALTVSVYAQSIVTPVFVHKDGEASPSGYLGAQKDILVDGGIEQISGWATFQTAGVDLSRATSATLALYVKTVEEPGTLDIYALTAEVTAPENCLPLSSLSIGTTAVASLSLNTAHVETVVQFNITAETTDGTFYGVALQSDDGLVATFGAKEGDLPPLVLLTHDIDSAAAAWHSGSGAPAPSTGKDGDFYLDSETGDVYAKASGVWSVRANIAGPRGPEGPEGPQGPAGPQGSFPSGSAVGDMQYWDGSEWVMIPAGRDNQVLTMAGGIPRWAAAATGTLVDIDGNVYTTIVIGNQEWTIENIATTRLNDGTLIPNVEDGAVWDGLSTPGRCYLNNDSAANADRYGALYNWYAVNTGKLAPPGWRVPSRADWDELKNYLIDNGYNADGTTSGDRVGKALAARTGWETSTTEWAVGNDQSANNSSGFSAPPSGSRNVGSGFANEGRYWICWSATESSSYPTNAWHRSVSYDFYGLSRAAFVKEHGHSVRLVRDTN